MKGTLFIVSTPIGNLEDITFRALRILKEADVIAAEDTRHTQKLLSYYGIKNRLISYWGSKEKEKSRHVLKMLHSGQSVALVSDAGTPGISDPGSVLIKKAIEEGITVISVPGPSAVIAALSISGLSTLEFTFIGFLNHHKSRRRKILRDLSFETRTLVFYEAPHRILEALSDMADVLGNRKVVVVKEISKFYEEVFRGNILEIYDKLKESTISGEYVIIVEGKEEERRYATDDILLEVKSLMKKGLGRKEAVKKIAETYGLSKKELYDKSLNKNP